MGISGANVSKCVMAFRSNFLAYSRFLVFVSSALRCVDFLSANKYAMNVLILLCWYFLPFDFFSFIHHYNWSAEVFDDDNAIHRNKTTICWIITNQFQSNVFVSVAIPRPSKSFSAEPHETSFHMTVHSCYQMRMEKFQNKNKRNFPIKWSRNKNISNFRNRKQMHFLL